MHACYLVALIVTVSNDLAASTERLPSERWTRMTFVLDGLVEVAVAAAIPVVAVIDDLSKLPYRDFADARVG